MLNFEFVVHHGCKIKCFLLSPRRAREPREICRRDEKIRRKPKDYKVRDVIFKEPAI